MSAQFNGAHDLLALYRDAPGDARMGISVDAAEGGDHHAWRLGSFWGRLRLIARWP